MSNITVTVTLPAHVVVESRGQSVTVDMSTLSPEIVAQLVAHGVTQKVADKAASALSVAFKAAHEGKDAESIDARKAWGESNPDAVAKATLALLVDGKRQVESGDWTIRASGSAGLSDAEKKLIKAARGIMQVIDGAADSAYRAIDSGERAARDAFVLEWARNNESLIPQQLRA